MREALAPCARAGCRAASRVGINHDSGRPPPGKHPLRLRPPRLALADGMPVLRTMRHSAMHS
eukprot:159983-Pyramimonas_sp.AAC.1